MQSTARGPTGAEPDVALDFMADALYDRRRLRALTIFDEGNREGLAIDVGPSVTARRLIRVLEELIALHGRPAALRLDNGPALTAQGFIERFNRSYRTEVFDADLFESLARSAR